MGLSAQLTLVHRILLKKMRQHGQLYSFSCLNPAGLTRNVPRLQELKYRPEYSSTVQILMPGLELR